MPRTVVSPLAHVFVPTGGSYFTTEKVKDEDLFLCGLCGFKTVALSLLGDNNRGRGWRGIYKKQKKVQTSHANGLEL